MSRLLALVPLLGVAMLYWLGTRPREWTEAGTHEPMWAPNVLYIKRRM